MYRAHNYTHTIVAVGTTLLQPQQQRDFSAKELDDLTEAQKDVIDGQIADNTIRLQWVADDVATPLLELPRVAHTEEELGLEGVLINQDDNLDLLFNDGASASATVAVELDEDGALEGVKLPAATALVVNGDEYAATGGTVTISVTGNVVTAEYIPD